MTAPSTASASGLRSTRALGQRWPRAAGLAACLASGLLAAALLVLPASSAWSADAARGKALFGQCKRCHQVGSGAAHRIGPHLNDVFGRAAGSLEKIPLFRSDEGGRVRRPGLERGDARRVPRRSAHVRAALAHEFRRHGGCGRQGGAPGMAARLFRRALRSVSSGADRHARGIRPRSRRSSPSRETPNTAPISQANAPPATDWTAPTRASPR